MDLDCRVQLPGLGDAVSLGELAPSRCVNVEATDRAFPVDAVECRRRAPGAADAQPLFLFGVAFPLGWLAPPRPAHLFAVVSHPLTRIAPFALCTLSLFHRAHRFRYTLSDGLQIKHLNEVINLVCYGGAIVGSVVAASLMLAVL
jgi:fumarate reductase subunit D